jgi:hypothetical protein
VRRHLHLLIKLSSSKLSLLIPLFEVFASCQSKGDSGGVVAKGIDSTTDDENLSDKLKCEDNYKTLLSNVIRSEIINIVPIMRKVFSPENIFLSIKNSPHQATPLVIDVLEQLYSDIHMPPSEVMVRHVLSYLEELPASQRTLRLLIPIIGGMKKDEVIALLPKLIISLKIGTPNASDADIDVMRKLISRITQARPPVLPRALLLVVLHRYLYIF